MNDLDLLRRFEPVIRYTEGEMFFPCAVDDYLAYCSLWLRDENGEETLLLPTGSVDAEKLAAYDLLTSGAELSLRFVDEPLSPLAYQRWLNREGHPIFDSVGRLSRVGILGRFGEMLFDLSLLVRGRVAGGTTGRAEMQYQQMMADDPRYVYYGRVLKDEGYTILHYLFFYAMNDWRSSFHGVNDHESDWEQIFIYLTEEEGDFQPQWVAFAAHDFAGDDLRRRWDDPELQKIGENHVVVFAGAGSHAAYVLSGEYLMHFEPPALRRVSRALRPVRQYIEENLRADSDPLESTADAPIVSLAFVDYARGDGLAIGPGQSAQWSPELISDDLPWVSSYRGLWGLDTRDRFGGERAPAGPKFDRDGSVRHAWHDPLGWSGLDKVATPERMVEESKLAIAALEDEARAKWEEIEQKRAALRLQGLAASALAGTANLERQSRQQAEELKKAEDELEQLSAEHAALLEKQRILSTYLERVQQGDPGNPQAHLKHKAVPEPPLPPIARVLDIWSAVSGALIISILIVLAAWSPPQWPLWAALSILVFGGIEAALRGRLTNYLVIATIILAIIAAVALFIDYWRWLLPGGLLILFFYSLLANLRELRARRSSNNN